MFPLAMTPEQHQHVKHIIFFEFDIQQIITSNTASTCFSSLRRGGLLHMFTTVSGTIIESPSCPEDLELERSLT